MSDDTPTNGFLKTLLQHIQNEIHSLNEIQRTVLNKLGLFEERLNTINDRVDEIEELDIKEKITTLIEDKEKQDKDREDQEKEREDSKKFRKKTIISIVVTVVILVIEVLIL